MPHSDTAPSGFWQAVRTNLKAQHQALAIQPMPRNEPIPLSLGQERLWLIDQLQPGNTVHNLRAAFRLQGDLDVDVLEKSLQEIVRRHDILRTTFPEVDGQPVQVMSPEVAFTLPIMDLSAVPPQQQEADIWRLAAEAAQQPFDLAQGPLLRVQLLRLSKDDHVLLRTVHHIINDRWSDSVFMRELAVLYKAFCDGKPPSLPDLPIQYADFAYFQRQGAQGDELETQLRFWKQQLSGDLAALRLPTDASSSVAPTYQGGTHYLAIPQAVTEALKTLSQQEEVSLFVILVAAFKTLLYQYSGQEDIVVCSPVAGRNRVETKRLIGYFNNLVLIRSDLGNNPSFLELVHRVSEAALGAFAHQDLPLQQVASALNLPGAVLSRTAFALQNVPSRPLKLAGVSVTPMDIEEGISNFDLFLSMRVTGEELTAILRYKTDLYKPETVHRMLERYLERLTAVAANPNEHLADLPLFADTSPSQPSDQPRAATYVAPQTEIERQIAAVWQDVLQVDTIGIHDNFFDMGGRSLGMVQVGSELRTLLGRRIAFADLFQYPTISGMARLLGQRREEQSERHTPHNRAQQQQTAMKRRRQLMERRRK